MGKKRGIDIFKELVAAATEAKCSSVRYFCEGVEISVELHPSAFATGSLVAVKPAEVAPKVDTRFRHRTGK